MLVGVVVRLLIGADIVILDMPLPDTRKDKDLIGTLITDIVLQLLSYVAETERMNIRQRQKEGIAVARLKGVHLGRYPDPIPEAFFPVYEKWEKRFITGAEAAEALGMTQNQFEWMKRKYRKKARGQRAFRVKVHRCQRHT